jgi:hypothetical protein
MLAIKGDYTNGILRLDQKAPVDSSRVTVLFPIEEAARDEKMSTDEALRIFHKHAGSIKGSIDAREERLHYLDERYGNID